MCDLAKGEAEQFDVIASNTHSEGLSVFQGQVQNTEISDSVGLGVRVIKDGRPGYAHTERLTDEALRQTLKDALCHTQWTEKIDITLPQAVELPKGEPNYNPALESLDLATMKDFCIELEKATFAKSKEIENIPYLGGDIERDYSVVANLRSPLELRFCGCRCSRKPGWRQEAWQLCQEWPRLERILCR